MRIVVIAGDDQPDTGHAERCLCRHESRTGELIYERPLHKRDDLRAGSVAVPNDRWHPRGHWIAWPPHHVVRIDGAVAASDSYEWQSDCGVRAVYRRLQVGSLGNRRREDRRRTSEFDSDSTYRNRRTTTHSS